MEFLFSSLHRACCRVTQLIHQLMHLYKIYNIYTLKTLRHVSVLGPSSGSHIVPVKVTIKSHINFAVPVGYCGSMPCCVMLCCEVCPAGHSWHSYTTRHTATTPNWYSEINVTFYSDFSKDDTAP